MIEPKKKVKIYGKTSNLPMHTWHWQTSDQLPYLTCSLLQPWQHGFFTQQCWPRSPLELTTILAPQAPVYRLKQVHGNTVLKTTQIRPVLPASDSHPEADGLVTAESQQAVWVASADCTPVLIADTQTGLVGAVHAGWRGTAAKIVPAAIERMQEVGSNLDDLRIAMGPAIAGEVYQVSEEVAREVSASLLGGEEPSLWQDLPGRPVLEDYEPGKVRLDVRRVIATQLEQMGVTDEQVAMAPYCTYQTPTHFFSYRRDGLKKVQWSGIVSAG